jgi:hypothetical protein
MGNLLKVPTGRGCPCGKTVIANEPEGRVEQSTVTPSAAEGSIETDFSASDRRAALRSK